MIDVSTLTMVDVGRRVVFHARAGVEQEGIITSYNDRYIFVCYGRHNCGRGVATHPTRLKFSEPLAPHLQKIKEMQLGAIKWPTTRN